MGYLQTRQRQCVWCMVVVTRSGVVHYLSMHSPGYADSPLHQTYIGTLVDYCSHVYVNWSSSILSLFFTISILMSSKTKVVVLSFYVVNRPKRKKRILPEQEVEIRQNRKT